MQRCFVILLVILAACAVPNAAQTPLPTEIRTASLTVSELLASTPASGPVTVAGYVYLVSEAAILADSVSFSASPSPQLLGQPPDQIWLPSLPTADVAAALQRGDDTSYGIVQAAGMLEGPGTFGPDGQHRYQLRADALTPLMPQTTTITTILATDTFDDQVVQVPGELLANDNSALLVEALSAGGVPAPDSLQIKLAPPLDDQALLQRLSSLPNTAVRFGPVEVIGVWRRGTLHPLAIMPSTR